MMASERNTRQVGDAFFDDDIDRCGSLAPRRKRAPRCEALVSQSDRAAGHEKTTRHIQSVNRDDGDAWESHNDAQLCGLECCGMHSVGRLTCVGCALLQGWAGDVLGQRAIAKPSSCRGECRARFTSSEGPDYASSGVASDQAAVRSQQRWPVAMLRPSRLLQDQLMAK